MPAPATLTCLRCGYSWRPLIVDDLPRACPRCHSPRWNLPRLEIQTRPKPETGVDPQAPPRERNGARLPAQKKNPGETPEFEKPIRELTEIAEAYHAEFPKARGLRVLGADWCRQFREHCEARLYVFAKYVLGMREKPGQPVGLDPGLHGQVCDWLQD